MREVYSFKELCGMYVSMEKNKHGPSRFWYPWEIGPYGVLLTFITQDSCFTFKPAFEISKLQGTSPMPHLSRFITRQVLK